MRLWVPTLTLVPLVALGGACGGGGRPATREDFGDAETDVRVIPPPMPMPTTRPPVPHFADAGPDSGSSALPPWSWMDASAADCPGAARLVYVTGPGNELYSFYPPTLTFAKVGPIKCGGTPTHMTVDRHGIAWVVSAGKLYRVSTANASCAEVTTWKPDPARFEDFALSFAQTSAGSDAPLTILGQYTEILAQFDPASGAVTSARQAAVTSSVGDLTTDGTGKLFLLVDESTRSLVELDPSTAKPTASYAVNDCPVGDQALAFYGGAFYVFEGTAMLRYDVKTRTSKSLGTAPLQVTGAGQSTCVPQF